MSDDGDPPMLVEMKRSVLVIAVVALGLAACRKRYSVPPTVEGNACIRECMSIKQQCLAGAQSDGWKQLACTQQEDKCQGTCPGAVPVDTQG